MAISGDTGFKALLYTKKLPSGQNPLTRGAKTLMLFLALYPTERGGIVDAKRHDLSVIRASDSVMRKSSHQKSTEKGVPQTQLACSLMVCTIFLSS